MIKNITALEIEISGKIYKFICDMDAPLGAVHDAISQMKAFVVQKINDVHTQEQPKVTVESPEG